MNDTTGLQKVSKFGLFMWGAAVVSLPFRLLLARPGSVGRRVVRNPAGVLFALAPPAVVGMVSESPWMGAVFALCVLGFLLHLRKNAPHSMDVGTSWFSKLGEKQSRQLEVCVLAVAALGGLTVHPAVAVYLAAAAAGHAMFTGWIGRVQQETDTDLADAQIEARNRAYRIRDMS